MRTLAKPSLDPKTVYLTCVSRVQDEVLKEQLESISETIKTDAKNYNSKAELKKWYLIDESDGVDNIVSKDEMEKVYTNRMANKKSPGRHYYNEIKESSPFNICPLCAHRTVEQVDHYLPKSKFSSLVVVPNNLVPSCEKCNKIKLDDAPSNNSEQTLHPYYDDVTHQQWLFAEVLETSPASFRFFVKKVEEFDDNLNVRISYHFRTLELGVLYASQTGAFISDIQYRLVDLYEKGGLDEVRDYLKEEEKTRSRNNVNSWQRAMFQALYQSDWFCDGGFEA